MQELIAPTSSPHRLLEYFRQRLPSTAAKAIAESGVLPVDAEREVAKEIDEIIVSGQFTDSLRLDTKAALKSARHDSRAPIRMVSAAMLLYAWTRASDLADNYDGAYLTIYALVDGLLQHSEACEPAVAFLAHIHDKAPLTWRPQIAMGCLLVLLSASHLCATTLSADMDASWNAISSSIGGIVDVSKVQPFAMLFGEESICDTHGTGLWLPLIQESLDRHLTAIGTVLRRAVSIGHDGRDL